MAQAPTPAELAEQLRSLVATNVAGNVELVARLNGVLRDAAAAGPAAAPTDAGAVLARLVEAGLASYAVLSRHTLALLHGLVGVAERALVPGAGPAPVAAPAGDHRVDAHVEGPPGERVPCPFLVENQYDQAVDVSFRADPLTAAGHPDQPASLVSFEPARLSILPGGSAVATALVDVTGDFAVGATYTTTVRLAGFEGRQVRIALTVAAPAAGAVHRARPPRLRRADGAAR